MKALLDKILPNSLSRQNLNVAGVDISSSAVKVLTLTPEGNTYKISSYGYSALPDGAVVDKEIKDPAAVSHALSAAIRSARSTIKEVAIALADSSVITKVIQMDATIPKSDLEEQILYEADKYIPYPIEEVRMDFIVLGKSAKDERYNDILLAASRTQTIDGYQQAILETGLNLKIVDVESFALQRICQFLLNSELKNKDETAETNKTFAVIDIGSHRTTLTVYDHELPVFNRSEGFGGHQLTQQIAQTLEIKEVEAEAKIHAHDFDENLKKNIIQPFCESLTQNISRSMQFFYTNSEIEKVDQLLLVGGCAFLPGLADMVQKKLEMPLRILNPLEKIQVDKHVNTKSIENIAPSLLLCCGLAMRGYVE